MRVSIVLSSALVALAAAGCARPAAAPPTTTPAATAAVTQRQCGIRTMQYRDPSTGQQTPLTLYYPTAAPEQVEHRGPYTMSVAADAPIADGRWPLVMLSHGSGGTMLGHHDTAAHLARHGFIVVAPLHAGNNTGDHSAEGTPRMWRGRPRALIAALDAALADPQVAAHVDPARIGAAGFSAGGYTVLVAAGGVGDIGALARHCRAHADDLGFCGMTRDPAARAAVERDEVHAADKRIRAVVAMAPVGVPFEPGSLAGVTVPVRLYGAEHDEVLLPVYNAEHVQKLLPKPPEYTRVAGAGHYAFLAPFPEGLREQIGDAAKDPPGFDRAGFHERLNAEILDYFNRTLAATP